MSAAKKPAPKKKKSGNHREGVVKFDAIKKARYLELLRTGGRRHASARQVGVTPQTVVNHMKADRAFADEVSYAEMEADDEVEDALRAAAMSGNVTAALAWLYSRRPERWRDERHVKGEMTGKDGGPILMADMEAIRQKRWKDATPAMAAALRNTEGAGGA